MQKLINKILGILKEHVRQNNLEIELNKQDINRILAEGSSNMVRKDDLDYKKSLNHELIRENDDFLQMQLALTEFMEKYAHLISDEDVDDQKEISNSMPYLEQTIDGQLKFGPGHPQFFNLSFFNELLRYYEEKEDYEMCDQLVRIKRDSK